jgi:hypothetical protein
MIPSVYRIFANNRPVIFGRPIGRPIVPLPVRSSAANYYSSKVQDRLRKGCWMARQGDVLPVMDIRPFGTYGGLNLPIAIAS